MSLGMDLVNWTIAALEPYGPSGLFLLAFIESSFFVVPPDLLLIGLALLSPQNGIFYGAIATIGSVMGGIFGYWIGYRIGEPLLERIISKEKIEKVHEYFNRYEVWAVGIAGLTPIPYKVFTIASGVFYVDLRRFILASAIGRGIRFMTEGVILFLYGDELLDFLTHHFEWITLGVALIGVILGVIYYRLKGDGGSEPE
ncbi:MAG: DedA family protein [Candidatus Syntrophoarchaeum sp. WYZ-LMO15]|nr:MAG: DedA family protein [Candidatus Syntrophoarchaeum sp. WYZ-LMO15]